MVERLPDSIFVDIETGKGRNRERPQTKQNLSFAPPCGACGLGARATEMHFICLRAQTTQNQEILFKRPRLSGGFAAERESRRKPALKK